MSIENEAPSADVAVPTPEVPEVPTVEVDVEEPPVSARSRKTAVTIRGKTVYLNNKELLKEIVIAKKGGAMTDKLAQMLQLLCARYGRDPKFGGYSYNDDMQSYAMLMLVKTWHCFDPEKGSNPFAFYTQCIKNSFKQYLNHERKHRDIRDAELLNMGLNPSYGYESGVKDVNLFDDEQDFHATYAHHASLSDIDITDIPDIEVPDMDSLPPPSDDDVVTAMGDDDEVDPASKLDPDDYDEELPI
jgi:DNA-directed RNA polymerase specialized sigma24 family protein